MVNKFILFFIYLVSSTVQIEFWLDLDLPPNQRYKELFPKFTEDLVEFSKIWIQISRIKEDELNKLESLAENFHDRELVEDTKAVSDLTGIQFKELFYLQFMYDYGSTFDELPIDLGCTSIIVNPDNGIPYLTRNLDYSMQNSIRKLTNVLHFYRTSKENLILTTLGIVGQHINSHTLTTSFVSATINQLNPLFSQGEMVQQLLRPNAYSVIRLMFLAALNSKDFQQFQNLLLETRVNVNAIAAIVGIEGGSIIHVQDWSMDDDILYPKIEKLKGKSYLIATNGYKTNDSILRFKVASERMLQIQDLNDPQIVVDNVLSKGPNRNSLTILTAILSPNESHNIQTIYY